MRSLVVLGFQVFFLSCIYLPQVWTQRQSLYSGGRLSVGESLLSPSRYYEFGIFPLKNGKYYLCIRYAAPIETVVVWIANRDRPLKFEKSILILSNGNLELFDQINSINPYWSSNATGTSATVARLLDTGNVVLEDINGTIQTWNSFNNSITDTLLPDQYLVRSDPRQNSLISWSERDDPAAGNYTFGWAALNTTELHPKDLSSCALTNATLILQLACKTCKTESNSGVYIPAPDVDNPHIISNVDSVYLHKTLGALYFPTSRPENSTRPPASTLIFSDFQQPSKTTLKRLTLDTDGGLRIWEYKIGQSKEWTPVANWVVHERGTQCFVPGSCGPFGVCQMTPSGSFDRVQCTCPAYGFEPIDKADYSKGCLPRALLSKADYCPNSSLFNMTTLDGIDMPWVGDIGTFTEVNDSHTCITLCVNDCNCTGVVYSKDEKRCWRWKGDLYNLGYPTVALHGNDRTAWIKISTMQPHDHKGRKLWILGPVLGGVLGIVVLILCIYMVKESHLCGECWAGRAAHQPHGIPGYPGPPDAAPI